jgi:hypothetical protein
MRITSLFLVLLCLGVSIADDLTMAEAIQVYCNYDTTCVSNQPDPDDDIYYVAATINNTQWQSYSVDFSDDLINCPRGMYNDPTTNEICDQYISKTYIMSSCRSNSAVVCQEN